MGMNVGGKSGGVKSDINVTPLVDVVLVLLIIFMVITPELQRGKNVDLPKAASAKQKTDGSDPVIISIQTDKSVFIETNPVSLQELPDKLKDELAKKPVGTFVMVKGDTALSYGEVKKLVETIRKANIKDVSLAVAMPEKK